jgi:hypothetical protein
MKRDFILASISKRHAEAASVQQVLTDNGCVIRTRLGLHDAAADRCSENGVIFLELVGTAAAKKKLIKNLSAIKGVTVKTVSF